jgi:hypothetical protein
MHPTLERKTEKSAHKQTSLLSIIVQKILGPRLIITQYSHVDINA